MISMRTTGRRITIGAGLAAVVVICCAAWVGWPHLLFWYRFKYLALNAQGYPEYRHRGTGMVFVRLPGGEFSMGSPTGERGRMPEEVQHLVTLSPFLIAKYEVTQAQWRAVMGNNPSGFRGDDLPVETVSQGDCREFLRRTRLSLPTEVQWEYAAKAVTGKPLGGAAALETVAWCNSNSGHRTHPVGGKEPNEFGLHDLHGNVWEMCLDAYDPAFYGKCPPGVLDPVCTSESRFRVIRGGFWGSGLQSCRAAFRGGGPPDFRGNNVGFRTAYGPVP